MSANLFLKHEKILSETTRPRTLMFGSIVASPLGPLPSLFKLFPLGQKWARCRDHIGLFKINFFRIYGHVAYQIKGNEAYNNILENVLPLHTPLIPGLGSKGQDGLRCWRNWVYILWLTSFPCDKNSGERSRDHWPSSFTFCMLGNLSCFSYLTFSKKSFRNIFRVLNCPDQDKCSVSSDLGTNCLQMLSADD